METVPDPTWGPPVESAPDQAFGPPPAPLVTPARRRHPGWWATLGVLLVAIAVVAALGGFRTNDDGESAPRVAVGAPVRLANWTIVVLEAEMIDEEWGREIPTKVRVRMDITFHGDATEKSFPDGLVLAQLPAGERPAGARIENADKRKYSQFDPNVTERAWRVSTYEPGEKPEAAPVLAILINDQRWSDGLLNDRWVISGPVARVDVPLTDRRLHA